MLNRHYTTAFSTLYQARYGILIALLIYTGSCLGGWMYAGALGFLHQAAGSLAGRFAGKGGVAFIFSLFVHNLVATYITMCLLTLWGLILGWIVVTAAGLSPVDAATMLAPHGMFEWPAMMIAWVSVSGAAQGIGSALIQKPIFNAGNGPTKCFF